MNIDIKNSEHIAINCRACNELLNGNKNEYISCVNCKSINLASESDASDDNKEYFNSIFSNNQIEVVQKRKKMFENFSTCFPIYFSFN